MPHAHRECISSRFPARSRHVFSTRQCRVLHADSTETDPQGFGQHLIAIKPWWKQSISPYSVLSVSLSLDFPLCLSSHSICIVYHFPPPPCFLPFLLPKHRDQCSGTAFGKRKMIWRALIDLGTHHPSVSVPLCKRFSFSDRTLRHCPAPPTSAQMVIKSRSSSLIYQRLHVSSGPKPSALICCPASDEARQYIPKLFI